MLTLMARKSVESVLGANKSGVKHKECSKCNIEKGNTAFNAGESICRKCENEPVVSVPEIELEGAASDTEEKQACVLCGTGVLVSPGLDDVVVCPICEEKVEMELAEDMKP